jgi:UDP-glucose 4-epimerase
MFVIYKFVSTQRQRSIEGYHMHQKTILVVGGAGFIASIIIKMLHQAGYQTVAFDNLSTGSREAVTHGIFVKGDTANSTDLDNVFTNYTIDAVMHFAALIDVGESTRDPSKYYINNVVNTLNLLDAMRQHGINTLIFSSSAAIFGIPQEKYLTELHPCNPINPYGETKLMVEKILRDYDTAYGFKSCSLRYFNAAGGDPEGEIKNYKRRESNLIPLILKSLKNQQRSITIFGTDYPTPDGTCIRDYIHVYDLGIAHIRAMKKLFEGGPSTNYNLGNGHGFSVREVIRAAEKVTGRKVNAIIGSRRLGDSPILVADSQKARRELDWHPQYPSLEAMIEHAWQALR